MTGTGDATAPAEDRPAAPAGRVADAGVPQDTGVLQDDQPGPPPQGGAWAVSRAVLNVTAGPLLDVRAAGVGHLDPGRGGLLLANHQSFLDPIVLGLRLDRSVTFLARDSLFRVPGFGRYLRAMKTLPIARDAPATAVMRSALAAMRRGELVGLFPEGTRTRDGRMGELKPGFVTLTRRGDAPVYPVGIAGTFEALPRTRTLPVPSPGRVRVVFGEPLGPADVAAAGGTAGVVELVELRIAAAFAAASRWRETGERSEFVDAGECRG